MRADGRSFSFDFHELFVDSFAGCGGASTGIRLALGRCPDVAVNHDGEALAMHEANHPATRHIREDVWAVDPEAAMGYRQVGLLWASPDCKHFSKAKGGKPVSKKIRGLAWSIVKWIVDLKPINAHPRVIIMENVEEFRTWGPLIQIDGEWMPDPARKGQTFERFTVCLRQLGYVLEHRELRACDYGAPTIRKRLFLIARRDGRPIVWPAPTHGKPGSLAVKAGKLQPWRTAAECIDWSIPCPSIFERKRPLAEATLRRIARGVMRYVVDAAEPFIVPIANYGSGLRVNGIDEPLTTITANPKGGAHAVVVPRISKLGSDDDPQKSNNHRGREDAARSTRLQSCSFGCVRSFDSSGQSRASDQEDGRGARFAAATLIQAAHGEGKPGDAQRWGNGTCDPHAPMGTLTASNSHALVAATLVQTGYGEREGQAPRSLDIEQPLGTVVGGGAKHAVVAAFLAQHNTERNGVKPGKDVRDPMSTLCASGSHQSVVTSHLVKLRGTCADGQPVTEPAPTVTASGTHIGEVRAFLVAYYGSDKDGQGMADPLRTMPTRDRFGLVTVHGEQYQIVDIGMRMLTPRELATAQGFPPDYIIDRGADHKPLTKTAQVRMIGNSVCPPVAAALVRANFQHEQPSVKARAA